MAGGASRWRTVMIVVVFVLLALTIFVIEQKLDAAHGGLSPKQFAKSLHITLNSYQSLQDVSTPSPSNVATRSQPESPSTSADSSTVSTGPKILPNPPQKSRFAYVTLISGIDQKFKYRGFLYNALIMHRSLEAQGSTADFIAMIGYSENDTTPFIDDMNMLKSHGIIIHELPRLVDPTFPLKFAEMALLKITPYSFTQYEKVQFFDGDVMPTKNMDCFFEMPYNAFTIGAVSPLNSGWFLAIPNEKAFHEMREKAIWRLFREWDEKGGWENEELPPQLTVRGGRPVSKPKNRWNFNGADMDQGLFTHYYVIHHGNVILMDTDLAVVRHYRKGIANDVAHDMVEIPAKQALDVCHSSLMPTRYFAHFTGRSKPWMNDLRNLEPTRRNADLITWAKLLDGMKLPVNSSTIGDLKLGSPLGFFNVGFPKGGYKKKPQPSQK